MSTTATHELQGTYAADGVHSVFGFSVLHNGISAFKGTMNDVTAELRAGEGLELEGAAKVESISIVEPEQLRAHVLSEEFFDAANHPEVSFRSQDVELSEDGRVRVEGELTIKGITKDITATGTYRGPVIGPDENQRAAFELAATFDRRDYGFDWQMELPGGGNALDWDITLNVHLELVKESD